MPSLPEVQRAFYRQVTQPGLPDRAGLFAGHVEVYAEMYFERLHDVLAEQHERLAAALGPLGFRNLVRSYLVLNPPESFDIGDAGARLPEHLEGPLADLARLERLHVDLFTAADAPALDPSSLAGLSPEELEALPLRLVPSAALHAPDRLLVYRDDVTITERRVPDDVEWEALVRCRTGCTVGELGAQLAADRSIDDTARALFDFLRRNSCVLEAPSSPPPSPACSPPPATRPSRRSRRARPRPPR